MNGLRCHCDHCPNSTCTILEHGLCYAQLSLDKNNQLERKSNCFNQASQLLKNLICDNSTALNKAPIHKIIRCCDSKNYCNQEENFLPPNDEALRILIPQGSHSPQTFDPYSNIPPELKLIFIVFSGLLIITALALAQNCFSRRKRKRPSSLLDTSAGSGSSSASNSASNQRHNESNSSNANSNGNEDHSENSSGLVNSDAAVYDTNSMASREPLINSNIINCTGNHGNSCNNTPNSIVSSLTHPLPHRGPWMADGTINGHTTSTFRMSIGSGDTRNKPETSSGSGSGQPYLTQRSIAHDIELVEVVGRGYFGVVWRGEYKGEPVAVKIFSALAEPSWEREAEIYQTTLLRHKNILGFIATDKRTDVNLTSCFWLVTDYYPLGSLYDFLKSNTLVMPDAVRMAFSIANGLAHLHVEIFGTKGKPAIAHRDLKSKNILVKNDGTCCIADLGMAVRFNSNSGIVDVPSNTRVGTRRYLAPELLENKLNLMDFEAVKSTDVYALGLVLWELLRRTCFVRHNHQQQQLQGSPLTPANKIPAKSYAGTPVTTPLNPTSLTPATTTPILVPPTTSMDEEEETDENQPLTKPKLAPQIEQQHTETESLLSSRVEDNAFNRQYQYEEQSQQQLPRASLQRNNPDELLTDTSIDDMNHELATVCDPYEAPYQQFVSIDPTTEEMRDVVCNQKIRPPLSLRWTKFAPMREYTNLMRECWYEKPQARLSALRVRKTLGDIARRYFKSNMEYD